MNQIIDKIPPQNIEVEKAILGVCMLERDAFEKAAEFVSAESFYNTKHQKIFQAMADIHKEGGMIDILTVTEKLTTKKELDAGDAYYIVTLTNNVSNGAHIIPHSRIVAGKYIQRELIKIGSELVAKGYDDGSDVVEIIEAAEQRLFQATNALTKGEVKRIDAVLVQTLQRIEEMRHRDGSLTGVTTGFDKLDRLTCGWQPTDLVVLAARPACGKSAFALNLIKHAADAKIPAAVFSLEMSASQICERILANESQTPLGVIRDARLSDGQMERLFTSGAVKLAKKDIYIDDKAALNVYEFKAKARRLVQKHGVRLIILDYLQLMKPAGNKQSREQEISTISRELKIAAKELGVPIIALSQLSREVERRSNNQPQLSDLRESGAIEQDADMVCFLYRRSEADILMNPELANDVFFKIAKHRNGELGTLLYDFDGGYQRFEEKNDVDVFASQKPAYNF